MPAARRDERGGGVTQLQRLCTATLVVMLAAVPVFGMLVARFLRRRIVLRSFGWHRDYTCKIIRLGRLCQGTRRPDADFGEPRDQRLAFVRAE